MTQPNSDDRQYAAATARNRKPILDILQQVLPKQGTVLEISSGTGEHVTFFASQMPHLQWQSSEPNPLSRRSIQAWIQALPAPNLLSPLALDVSQQPWPVEENPSLSATIAAIVNINMLHIAPWEMTRHLMAGAQRVLPTGGILYLYGPFKQANEPMAPSNEAFDRMLRDRNERWGIRDLAEVSAIAQSHGLQRIRIDTMPANNLSVTFQRLAN